MNISTVVVVLVLIALSLGAIICMEIHSRKTSSKEHGQNAKSSESGEKELAAPYSPFLTLRLNGATSSRFARRRKNHDSAGNRFTITRSKDDLDGPGGWLTLIRSRSVLGKRSKS